MQIDVGNTNKLVFYCLHADIRGPDFVTYSHN